MLATLGENITCQRHISKLYGFMKQQKIMTVSTENAKGYIVDKYGL